MFISMIIMIINLFHNHIKHIHDIHEYQNIHLFSNYFDTEGITARGCVWYQNVDRNKTFQTIKFVLTSHLSHMLIWSLQKTKKYFFFGFALWIISIHTKCAGNQCLFHILYIKDSHLVQFQHCRFDISPDIDTQSWFQKKCSRPKIRFCL